MITRLLTGKALVALAAASVFSAGAAAAATGSLPDPVQRTVSNSLSHVGVNVPDPHGSSHSDARDEGTDESTSSTDESSTTDGVRDRGPDASGPAQFGLCTAFLASENAKGKNMEAPPFKNLAAEAAKSGKSLHDFCTNVTTGSTTSSSSTSSSTTSSTSSTSTTDEPDFPGNSENTPAATAPGRNHGNGHG